MEETSRDVLLDLLESDPTVLVWWGTPVECVSAIARREREGFLPARAVSKATERLRALAEGWEEVQPTEPVRSTAERLLRVHPLRAADSLQLAAAIIASERDPASLEFVTLDDRLGMAAGREGFRVLSVPEV